MVTETQDMPFLAFTNTDVERANAEWGCNCGPAALAACLDWTLEQVRPHLGEFERKGYMNMSMMRGAITAAGHRYYQTIKRSGSTLYDYQGLPDHGLVVIQWGVPGIEPGARLPRWASNYTHWIATKFFEGRRWAFDVNGLWRPWDSWEGEIVPLITASIKRATGRYWPTHAWEVRRKPTH